MCSTSEIGSHHLHVGRHDGTTLARPLHELLFTLLAEAQAEGRGDADRAADDVAKGYGQEVLDQESFPGELRARENSERHNEHVRDGVLEAERDERRDAGAASREDFLGGVL